MNDVTSTAAPIGASLPRRSTQLLTGPMFRAAVRDAFVKLDPRLQIRNPVMLSSSWAASSRPLSPSLHLPARPARSASRGSSWPSPRGCG
jgi:hypothetical protein